MINVQPLFTSFVATETLNVDNEPIKQHIYELENKDSKGREYSNVGGWQSNFLDLKEPRLKQLFDTVTFMFNEVAISLGFIKKNYFINSAWANVNRKYHYNAIHYHPGSFLAGVYYVDGGENKGVLKFNSPVPYVDTFYDNTDIQNFNEFNSCSWTMPCSTGSLIMFPAWLMHDVSPNLSDEDRISIAFNIDK